MSSDAAKESREQLGHVKDVVVRLSTGRRSYEVSHGRWKETPTTILLPGEVLRVGQQEDVFVADVDERELTRIG